MRWRDIGGLPCSVARALSVVGDRWTLLILRDTFLGVRRFEDFQRDLGTTRHRLTDRLRTLVAHGILERVRYQTHPPRFEYRLTDKGRDLWHVITAMRQWGDRHAAPDGPPMELIHKSCAHVSEAAVVCSECGEPMGARDVRAVPGPGAVEPLVPTASS